MPYSTNPLAVEKAQALAVAGKFRSVADGVLLDCAALIGAQPAYPGGPLVWRGYESITTNTEQQAAQTFARLAAKCKDIIDNEYAALPESVRSYIEGIQPEAGSMTSLVDSVRDVAESFPVE